MCGIAGLVDLGGINRAIVAPRLAAALDRLRRRGPDGEATWFDERAAFGHRRLAIIDLTQAAAQPMAAHGFVVTYNGEVYNFTALREELAARGHRFQTQSDTEILLAGWREWGEGLLDRISAMFAFALWDPEKGELILARDRFGKKPLLFHHDGKRLAFASDLIALEKLVGTQFPIDPEALRLYVALRFVPEPRSIASGVTKVPPGHIVRFSSPGMSIARWYRPERTAAPVFATEDEAASVLRRHLKTAVADRLVADVPVGAFLSGGIDSSIIAAVMAERGGTVRTFTVGFAGAPEYYEERPAALAVANHLGTKHTEISVSANDALAALPEVFAGLDEPFADSSAVPTYLVSRATRTHVTVALSGDGADEVFGGYRRYQGELYAERYRRLPRWLRKNVIESLVRLLPESKDNPVLEASRRIKRFAAHAGKTATERQAGWARSLNEDELDALLVSPAPAAPTVEALVGQLRDGQPGSDPINIMLGAEIAFGLPGDMLVKVDRMSMANGLEVRCPYLDHHVIECAAAMPGGFKLAPGLGKRILRRAFADVLPASVFTRPKKGFELPVAAWLTGDLADGLRRAIDPARLRRQGLFRPEPPQRWLADLKSGRRDTAWTLWTLLAFQSWAEAHGRPEARA